MEKVVYREPTDSDAQSIVDFYNRVGGETTYLSFGGNEYPLNVETQIDYINNTKEQDNAVMILALVDNNIIAIGTIASNQKIKSKHNGELGIVVEAQYQGKGIGNYIIGWLCEWCRSNEVTKRIQLDVRTDNESAVKLYEKFGFVKVGKLENQTLIEDKYYHLYVMELMI